MKTTADKLAEARDRFCTAHDKLSTDGKHALADNPGSAVILAEDYLAAAKGLQRAKEIHRRAITRRESRARAVAEKLTAELRAIQ